MSLFHLRKRITRIFNKAKSQGESGILDCPVCGREQDGYMNVERSHYIVCDQCKMFFLIGENLFSDWTFQTEEDWKQNIKELNKLISENYTEWNPPSRKFAGQVE